MYKNFIVSSQIKMNTFDDDDDSKDQSYSQSQSEVNSPKVLPPVPYISGLPVVTVPTPPEDLQVLLPTGQEPPSLLFAVLQVQYVLHRIEEKLDSDLAQRDIWKLVVQRDPSFTLSSSVDDVTTDCLKTLSEVISKLQTQLQVEYHKLNSELAKLLTRVADRLVSVNERLH